MNEIDKEQIEKNVRALCEAARDGAPTLALASNEKRNEALFAVAAQLLADKDAILAANARDMVAADENGVPRPMLDRLALSEARLCAIAEAVKKLAALPDPLAESQTWERPAGITITRKKVPLGYLPARRPGLPTDGCAARLQAGRKS